METLDQNTLLQGKLNELLEGRLSLSVLEAGCGSKSHIEINNTDLLAGVDISEKQLARNTSLHEKILGDIQVISLGVELYDVIVSWDVLEHLKMPGKALENLFGALKPGGVLILAAPICYSLKGLVSKVLPYSGQIFFYRHVVGDLDAGKDDYGPFKTYLHSDMWPANIKKRATSHGLRVAYYSKYEGPVSQYLRTQYKAFNGLIKMVSVASRFCSFGRYDAADSDYILVLIKEMSVDNEVLC